MDALSAP
jgi:hypothetical protein